jgi:hypothetical protein
VRKDSAPEGGIQDSPEDITAWTLAL